MLRRGMMLLLLTGVIPAVATAGQLEDKFWAAARKGDAAAVKALLARGVDVNTPFRYGATALSYACDRGHVEVVKVLLEHGARANVKDTFYGATPLTWASMRSHTEVVRMLLDKCAEGKEGVLRTGASRGKLELVKVVLDSGGLSAETLSSALASANRNGHTEVAELLRKAGATPPRPADVKVDPEALRKYAGVYRDKSGTELRFTVREGKLRGEVAGQSEFAMTALSKVRFSPAGNEGVTITFNLEGGKVVSATVNQAGVGVVYRRVEGKQQ